MWGIGLSGGVNGASELDGGGASARAREDDSDRAITRKSEDSGSARRIFEIECFTV